jgi:hypothetical protein
MKCIELIFKKRGLIVDTSKESCARKSIRGDSINGEKDLD